MAAATSPSVLEAPPPRFSSDEVARIAADLFGISGAAVDLGSERDQTFLIEDGRRGGVLKISNLGEDAAVLDLETQAILHVCRVDPELPVARPVPAAGGESQTYHPTVEGPDGVHFVRLFERLRGRVGGPDLDDAAVFAYGATQARLNAALRAFFHPAAGRELLWNLKHSGRLRPLVGCIAGGRRRALVEAVLERYEERIEPGWMRLRAQVVHGDFSLDNVLLDERARISGIVDFGDTAHMAEVADFAVALASVLRGRTGDDVFRVARIAIDGYESCAPFEPDERAVLADLVAARLAAIVTISAWRVARYPENAEYIQSWDADSWELLELFDALGPARVAVELGARPRVGSAELARRRRKVLGSALTRLSYRVPVHVARGRGAWLFGADGERLLDAYNNVPVVGHCHPRVTEAVVRQTRTLNTHARYLYDPLVELGERLVATMPRDSGLDTVMLVNSGSEANDLAWRLATAITGHRGALASEHAYHGMTSAVAEFSPEEWPPRFRAANVATFAPPGATVSVDAELARGIGELEESGAGVAATYVDGGFTSDGIREPRPEDLGEIVRQTHAAGGLVVADEVQVGHGRTGGHLWSFVHHGITPDVVTLGKPMGNGYPVAAVITREEIFDRFGAERRLFSTFGGNPVAAAAALAVLDVIEDERLIANAARVGAHLRRSLDAIRARHPSIAEVRGLGLLIGVELVDAEPGRAPAPLLAERVVDHVRDAGILIGLTGRDRNVLKIRPPLVFSTEHADAVADALDRALREIASP